MQRNVIPSKRFLAIVPVLAIATLAPAADWTMQLELRGQTVEGKPVTWSTERVLLMGRDGHLWDFAPKEASNFRKVSSYFTPISQGELRGRLIAEFGGSYQVSGTGNYLVVHPAGQRDVWAPRFEELYRSFVHYFTARGFQPSRAEFPLVAVVFRQQEEFLRHARSGGARIAPGTLGYYSPVTNRILLFDLGEGQGDEWTRRENMSTIIHEATHQSAFNTGIHSRFGTPPVWVVEGLATMFEAPGVWNSRHHPARRDRLNRYRLERFRRYATSGRSSRALAEIVASDQVFKTNPDGAYAEAWALTFFLAETDPGRYHRFLGKTAKRADFSSYSASNRLRDFTDVFGSDLEMLNVRLLRFIQQLK